MDPIEPHKQITHASTNHQADDADPGCLPRHPIVVICDNIRSLVNVGLIFRLCDAARVERLYLCGITGYPNAPGDSRQPWVADRADRVIAKTAIHTVDSVPWVHHPDTAEVVRDLKRGGYQVVALEQTSTSLDYTRASYQYPLAVIVGHERQGIADPILALTDQVISIPMYGLGHSLNVATAAAIATYEILHSYLKNRVPSPGHPAPGT